MSMQVSCPRCFGQAKKIEKGQHYECQNTELCGLIFMPHDPQLEQKIEIMNQIKTVAWQVAMCPAVAYTG